MSDKEEITQDKDEPSSSSESESEADIDDVLLADFECQDVDQSDSRTQEQKLEKPEKSSDLQTDDVPKEKKSRSSEDFQPSLDTLPSNISENKSVHDVKKDEQLKVELPPSKVLKDESCEDRFNKEVSSSLAEVAIGATAAAACDDKTGDNGPSVYQVKWINFRSKEVPIITQNENGPCPLLAIMNVLLLKGKVKLTPNTEIITPEQLMTHLGDCILENAPKSNSDAVLLNYEQNMHDAMAVIHKLQTGLDVNVRFTGVQDFEYTPECIIFDLLVTSLYHGWLVDPQDQKTVNAVGTCSYNQLVEKIITNRTSDQEALVTEALLAEAFLDKSASQLTYHGLCELSATVQENELCVFFRNNHFSTMYRHKNELFLLVTDQGFLTESNVVWETLGNVEGDGYFVDAVFNTYTKPAPPTEPVLPGPIPPGTDEQVDQDYLLAMSLQQEQQMSDQELAWKQNKQQQQQLQLTDQELAERLQAEEDERAAQAVSEQQQRQQAQGQRSPRSGAAAQGSSNRRPRERERERDRDRDRDKSKDNCCIL